MTPIQIRKVNGVPMGRPCNPFEKYPTMPIILGAPETEGDEWLKLEQSVTEHEAPGCEEGEAEGVLIELSLVGDKWVPSDDAPFSLSHNWETKEIWRVVPAPEKAEVKEADNWIRCEDRLPEAGEHFTVLVWGSYTRDCPQRAMEAHFRGKGKYIEFRSMDGIKTKDVTHWQPLPSPPTH